MESNKKTARLAGVLYLSMIVSYMFSLGYVPRRFLVEGDAVATIENIARAEWIFRLGIVAGMVACAVYMAQVLVQYKLLVSVSRNAAVLMVAFAVAHLPLFFVGHVDELNLLSLLKADRYGDVLTVDQLHAHVMLLTDAYKNSVRVNEIFMSLWLIPFGYLVFKSGILPRFLGVWLILNSIPYFMAFSKQLLNLDYTLPSVVRYVLTAAAMGEIATCLWLLVMGARESTAPMPSAADMRPSVA